MKVPHLYWGVGHRGLVAPGCDFREGQDRSCFLTFLNCWFISKELQTASLWSWVLSTLCWQLWDWLVFSSLPFGVEICSPPILKHPQLLRATTRSYQLCSFSAFQALLGAHKPLLPCSGLSVHTCGQVQALQHWQNNWIWKSHSWNPQQEGKGPPESHSFGMLCLLNNELLF